MEILRRLGFHHVQGIVMGDDAGNPPAIIRHAGQDGMDIEKIDAHDLGGHRRRPGIVLVQDRQCSGPRPKTAAATPIATG